MITATSRAGQDYPRTWMHWLHELPVGQTCIHWCGVRFIDGRMGKGACRKVHLLRRLNSEVVGGDGGYL